MDQAEFDVEGFNRSMGQWAEDQKTAPPYFVADTRKTMQNLEAFLEKQGISVTKHSESLAPEKLWPEGYDAAVRNYVERRKQAN